jgi:hypothetical protein
VAAVPVSSPMEWQTTSRMENGHIVPALGALEVPLYRFFYEGDRPPKLPELLKRKNASRVLWKNATEKVLYLNKLREFLSKMEESDRDLLLYMASKIRLRRNSRV